MSIKDKIDNAIDKTLDVGERAHSWFHKHHKNIAKTGAGLALGGYAVKGVMKQGPKKYFGKLPFRREAYDLAESLTANFKPKKTIFAVKPLPFKKNKKDEDDNE